MPIEKIGGEHDEIVEVDPTLCAADPIEGGARVADAQRRPALPPPIAPRAADGPFPMGLAQGGRTFAALRESRFGGVAAIARTAAAAADEDADGRIRSLP